MTYETEFSKKTIYKVYFYVIAGILLLIKQCGTHLNLYLQYNIYLFLHTLYTISENNFKGFK